MASGLFDKGREGCLDGSINYISDTIKAILIRTVQGPGAGGNAIYTVNLATHQTLSDVPNNSYCRVATQTLSGKTATAGVADANDVTYPAVPAGDAIQAILIVKDPGTGDANARLLAYFDSGSSGFPSTPNGLDMGIVWDNGANKIFKL